MRGEILTEEQLKLLPLLRKFSRDFILVGGTAIALHLGHRRSIDFDLFSRDDFENRKIKRKISSYVRIERTYVSENGQYTILVRGVKITFYLYPYKIQAAWADKFVRIPDLLTLAGMKAFALGQRSKWKDYVDLYFILKDYYSIKEVSAKAKKLFGNDFNERIFREALVYFKDVDYREEVIYMKGFKVSDNVIKKELVDFSLR